MYLWGRKKGINLLTVADFTHPIWVRQARAALEEKFEGIYKVRNEEVLKQQLGYLKNTSFFGPYFILTTEISCIYTERGRVHKIHNLVFAPDFETVFKINQELEKRGFNLRADGRPILGISARNLLELLYGIDERIFVIPCHVWTPWFSLYGSSSGYDSINDCFGDYSGKITAVETGLSSDPSMNWRIKELENRQIVSFSDSHSLEKIGRENTVLEIKNQISNIKNDEKKLEITYKDIIGAFRGDESPNLRIKYTVEFYPEEGKYHFSGHRACGVSYSPEDIKEKGVICPSCQRHLTVGVMNRVEKLAGSSAENFVLEKDEMGVSWVKDKEERSFDKLRTLTSQRPPYVSLVPLLEILAEALGSGTGSQTVLTTYDNLVTNIGSEFEVLLRGSIDKIRTVAGDRAAEAIKRVRDRSISVVPGFDGEYGKVKIWLDEKEGVKKAEKKEEKVQLGLGF
ncbi:DNA helicase UvrD [Candidatus Parcubacteria bacterium]|nr:MAG: DNA helicase UvrD [Candidatus Parcubacteria bacterium]